MKLFKFCSINLLTFAKKGYIFESVENDCRMDKLDLIKGESYENENA